MSIDEDIATASVNAVLSAANTGSTGTGKRVAAASIEHNRRFQLEMGGKNPVVVLDDADLDVAVESVINSSFFSTGQRCTASSRIIMTEGIYDKFVAAAIEKLKGVMVDNALKQGTHIGPVVDEGQLQQDMDYIEIGRNISDGDLAYFTTLCPARTDIQTLVSVEGHCWAIEDNHAPGKRQSATQHEIALRIVL